MKGLRFPLAGLLATVTVAAVGIFALVNANQMVATIVWSSTQLVMLLALLSMVCDRGPRRSFWLGFAIIGYGYLVIAYFDVGWRETSILATRLILDLIYKYSDLARNPIFNNPFGEADYRQYYDLIGHCLFAWLFAFAGGWLACYFNRQRA